MLWFKYKRLNRLFILLLPSPETISMKGSSSVVESHARITNSSKMRRTATEDCSGG
eukprot:m.130759 g.130759  ORF g.130759 m.130759 type:complete len:56 (+) comp13727_c0_seq1:1897-2064(+)